MSSICFAELSLKRVLGNGCLDQDGSATRPSRLPGGLLKWGRILPRWDFFEKMSKPLDVRRQSSSRVIHRIALHETVTHLRGKKPLPEASMRTVCRKRRRAETGRMRSSRPATVLQGKLHQASSPCMASWIKLSRVFREGSSRITSWPTMKVGTAVTRASSYAC